MALWLSGTVVATVVGKAVAVGGGPLVSQVSGQVAEEAVQGAERASLS